MSRPLSISEFLEAAVAAPDPIILPMPEESAFRQWGAYEVSPYEAEIIALHFADSAAQALAFVRDPNRGGEIVCFPGEGKAGGAVLKPRMDFASGSVTWYVHAYHALGSDARDLLRAVRSAGAIGHRPGGKPAV